MKRRRLGSRLVALLCAYAFVLQAFLSTAALTAHAAASMAGLLCSAQNDAASPAAPAPPADPAKASCDLHCVAPGLGAGSALPAASDAALAAPVAAGVLAPPVGAIRSRAPHKTAQLPRAPPAA